MNSSDDHTLSFLFTVSDMLPNNHLLFNESTIKSLGSDSKKIIKVSLKGRWRARVTWEQVIFWKNSLLVWRVSSLISADVWSTSNLTGRPEWGDFVSSNLHKFKRESTFVPFSWYRHHHAQHIYVEQLCNLD